MSLSYGNKLCIYLMSTRFSLSSKILFVILDNLATKMSMGMEKLYSYRMRAKSKYYTTYDDYIAG